MKKIIIISSAIILVLTGSFVFMKNYFMFMPWEYEEGDALYTDWSEYHGEIEMYICSSAYETDEVGRYCAHITDESIIKDILMEYMSVDNVTHSRLEVQDADFPEDWGVQYIIEISRVDKRGDDGFREEGLNLFVGHIYENTTLAKSYKGVYYYFDVSNELYDFVTEYDDENIK